MNVESNLLCSPVFKFHMEQWRQNSRPSMVMITVEPVKRHLWSRQSFRALQNLNERQAWTPPPHQPPTWAAHSLELLCSLPAGMGHKPLQFPALDTSLSPFKYALVLPCCWELQSSSLRSNKSCWRSPLSRVRILPLFSLLGQQTERMQPAFVRAAGPWVILETEPPSCAGIEQRFSHAASTAAFPESFSPATQTKLVQT